MSSSSISVNRLWTLGDGTTCLLVERAAAPCFEICVVRGERVLRQHRLFARTTAQMVADTWCTALTSQLLERQLPPVGVDADPEFVSI